MAKKIISTNLQLNDQPQIKFQVQVNFPENQTFPECYHQPAEIYINGKLAGNIIIVTDLNTSMVICD